MLENNLVDEFDDIRPYEGDEFSKAKGRLLDDPEFADTLLSIKYPRLSRYFSWALRPYIRRILHREFDTVANVRDLQLLIGKQLESLLTKSGSRLTVSGLDQLQKDRAYLFISNHRDIAMDPAFVNLSLHRYSMETVRIAIGDNLLTKPFSSDLMRLNKSFIVRRSATGRREKLRTLTTLSRYIRHSLVVDGSHVWIAQREGRAKDGLDRTETALIKMLALSKERQQSFAEAMEQLHIVPVSISYMFDPCDLDKARELYLRRTQGVYEKSAHEDLLSLYKGIVGNKEAIHLSFGQVVHGCDSADQLAEELDRQIIGGYRLHATNLISWELLHGRHPRIDALKVEIDVNWRGVTDRLMARLKDESEGVRQVFLEMYANPVQSFLDLEARPLGGDVDGPRR